jgi:predicted SAM-dependent methyltransferase
MPNLDYFGADLYDCPDARIKMDLVSTPFRSEIFDAIICIHVLEHIEEDREAVRELYRVLKPGGWAVVSVPIRLDQRTYEDPTITLPEERERAFGETAHVRFYGYDLLDRLQECGFRVHLDRGDEVDLQTRMKYGLRDDENIFHCTKA